MLMIVLQCQEIDPAGLEPPAVARDRRKPTVKNTKNRPLRCDVTKGTIPQSSFVQHNPYNKVTGSLCVCL